MVIVMMGGQCFGCRGPNRRSAVERRSDRDHFGVVLEVDGEFGGDNIAKVYYTDGVTRISGPGRALPWPSVRTTSPPRYPSISRPQ